MKTSKNKNKKLFKENKIKCEKERNSQRSDVFEFKIKENKILKEKIVENKFKERKKNKEKIDRN